MSLISISHVNKHYKINRSQSFQVLKDINLSFDKGEFVSIVGESGSGKSTLMNLIGGLDSDYKGDIIVNGKPIHSFKERELDAYRKNNIGFIFQSFNLIPHLTVLDNVTIAMTLSNVSKKERIKRARELLDEVGLQDQMYKKPNQLSGGQKQRVAIARALANDPDIILADEPTGALDSKTAEQILELLQRIMSRGKLIIAVTHSAKVSKFGTRIVSIADGQIINDEKTKDKKTTQQVNQTLKNLKQNLSLFSATKLALNNMMLNAWRNVLISFGASIGITSVIIMLALGSGVESYITGEIQGNVDPLMIEVTKPANEELTRSPFATGGAFTEDDINSLSALNNINDIEKSSEIFMKCSITKNNEKTDIVLLQSLTRSFNQQDILYGELPADGEVMISKNIGESLVNEGESVENVIGSSVTLSILEQKDNKPIQLERDFIISGIVDAGGQGMMGDFTIIYIRYEDLSLIYEDNDVAFGPSTLYVYATNEEYVESIKEDISNMGYNGSRSEALLSQLITYLDIATMVLTGIAGISLIVSGIMIMVVLYISVIERTKEIGVLKAIGARRKDIKRIFFSEAALVGLLGGTFGVIIAILLGNIGDRIFSQKFDITLIDVRFEYMLFGLAVSTIVSIVAGFMPASKAAKLDPIQSLRHE